MLSMNQENSRKGVRNEGVVINLTIIVCFDEIKNTIVSKCSPFDINYDLQSNK
jgi:hypothetical protein